MTALFIRPSPAIKLPRAFEHYSQARIETEIPELLADAKARKSKITIPIIGSEALGPAFAKPGDCDCNPPIWADVRYDRAMVRIGIGWVEDSYGRFRTPDGELTDPIYNLPEDGETLIITTRSASGIVLPALVTLRSGAELYEGHSIATALIR